MQNAPPPAPRDAVRLLSPIVARWLTATPALSRAIDSPPSLRGLERTPAAQARHALRALRRRMLVHTATRELAGSSPLDTARQWAAFADVALALADRVAAAETAARFGPINTGRAVLALGKLGSEELNPSSDIDVVCVYGDDAAVASGGATAHEWHTDWARRLRGALADVDDDGFAFRVDFDLRPEGTRGPLVNSVDAMEDYYERFGRVWERVALLRLRASVDVGGVGAAVVRRLAPFVFRRTFDPRVVDELYAMKARLTDAAGRRSDQHFDVKRGVGAIREVEFVAQSLVLLHAGRVPALRTLQARPVTELLFALEHHGLLPFRTAHELVESYALLRRVEHALMYGEDRQTQALPLAGPERERVAAFVELSLRHAHNGVALSFGEALTRATSAVHDAFVRHLGDARDEASDDVKVALDNEEFEEARLAALARLGFPDAARAGELLRVLERRRGGPFSPARRGEPQARRFAEIALEHVARSVDPLAALTRLLDVLPGRSRADGAHVGGWAHPALLARLSDPRVVAVIVRLLALSAPLARALARLARQGRVDDTLLFALDARRPSARRLLALMRSADRDDDELAVQDIWHAKQEALFAAALPFLARVGAADAQASLVEEGRAVVDAQRRLSILAEACVRRALELGRRRLTRRHGEPPGLRFSIVALGSLGGRELGFFRDLDLAFVYDVDGVDGDDGAFVMSDGPRSIPASEYAVRLAQQVLWVLTSPVAADPLYPVDTRLRPSGSHGALTTSLSRFRAYHAKESALWERQALLRLRPIAGDVGLGRAVVGVARDALARPAADDAPPIGAALTAMRARMVIERVRGGGLDLKLGPGGIADVEFAVQGLQLTHASAAPVVVVPSTRRALHRLVRHGLLAEPTAVALRLGLDRLVRVRELCHLLDDHRPAVLAADDDRLTKLTQSGALVADDGPAAFADLAALMAHLRELCAQVLKDIDR